MFGAGEKRNSGGRGAVKRVWKVLAIIALGAALALAILNGWYYG